MLSRLLTKKEQFVLTGLAVAVVVGAGVLYIHQRSAASVSSESSPATSNLAEGEQPAAQEAPQTNNTPDTLEPPSSPIQETMAQSPETDVPEEPRSLTVSIAGAVLTPGVYVLDDGKRVKDLIDKAGGLRENADLSDINQAAWLIDGTTLTIPDNAPSAGAGNRPVVLGRLRTPRALNPPAYTLSGWQPRPTDQPTSGSTGTSRGKRPQTASSDKLTAGAGQLDLNQATPEQLETLPGIGPKLAEQIIQYRTATPFRAVDDLLNVSGIGPKRLDTLRPFVCVAVRE